VNNEYIFHPKIDLDTNKLKSIVYKNLRKDVPGIAIHQRLVESEPYLVEVQKKYPFLSNLYNIFSTPDGYVVPTHIDYARPCALNIPIKYTEDSYTIFYDVGDVPVLTRKPEKVYDLVNSKTTELFRFTLDSPVIMNTSVAHGVIGGPDNSRIIMSWSSNVSYDELRKLYG
jgi:hypothetical protein